MKNIAILGLGYVGFPLAVLCAENNYDVIGVDKNQKVIENLKNGKIPLEDEQLSTRYNLSKDNFELITDLKHSDTEPDIFVICVPTPVDENHLPILDYIENASESVSRRLKRGNLVILESTVHPGTTEEIVLPILEKSGLSAYKDFSLAYCPERIDPGNKKWSLKNIPRVLGATTEEGKEQANDFYKSVLESEVKILKSPREAEATKIMENAFRDINIAFVNEMAKSFDKAGIDVSEVIKGASTKPFAFMAHYPGCGVGGHCIPVDPYYLIESAKSNGFSHRFLSLAREINESMPEYTVELLADELNKQQKATSGSRIGLYGLTYKADVEDTRESPSFHILKKLEEKGAKLEIYDPFYREKNTKEDIDEFLKDIDYLVIATDHTEIKTLPIEKFKKNNIKIIIDGKNCLEKKDILNHDISYKGIGR